jgi:hypothetical protein
MGLVVMTTLHFVLAGRHTDMWFLHWNIGILINKNFNNHFLFIFSFRDSSTGYTYKLTNGVTNVIPHRNVSFFADLLNETGDMSSLVGLNFTI